MKLYKYFLKTLAGLLFVSSTIFAQLELSVYTDKDSYQYGEQIELFCKVTNNADTTFEFWSGSYQSCQAEFSFNDFNSWEYTICLATTELLTFNPKSSKIYSWKINPADYGLPNNDGEQMIVGNYYFGLTDTIYINAPQYLGGKLAVGFLPNNSDSVQSIKDSLNITVLNHSDYGTSISEVWQVEGFQIDSLINHFQKDSILTYMEKAVLVEYDDIILDAPDTGGEIKSFSLSQNYPNPFNPSTTIKYSIPVVETRRGVSQQTVSLKVYDILGREVATLVNKEQKPGNYEVKFVASELNSGIYFYKLQSGDFVESKKMLLLK